jgi:hypothetical protein
MSEPLHPPYNVTQPRQLQRWLDVNAQNGKLTRTRGNIAYPNFNLSVPSLGILVRNNSGGSGTFKLLSSTSVVLDSAVIADGDSKFFSSVSGVASVYSTQAASPTLVLPHIGWVGEVNLIIHTWDDLIPYNSSSNKVLQFNYSANKNFSLKNDDSFRAFIALFQDKICICIANVDSGSPYNTVARYKLTQPSTETISAPTYIGQSIEGGYFQIEFWSLPSYSFVITKNGFSPGVLNTSILGDLDYRYGTDFHIHSIDAVQVTNFANNNPNAVNLFNLPLTFNQDNINGLN